MRIRWLGLAFLTVLIMAAWSGGNTAEMIDHMTLKSLRVFAKEQQKAIERLEAENASLKAQLVSSGKSSPPAGTQPAQGSGVEVKIVPGTTYATSPTGVDWINFNVKITNTTSAPITVGQFNLLAYDEDGDEIERIDTADTARNTTHQLFVDVLEPKKAVSFSPTMSAQNYPRLKKLVMVWGKAINP